MNWSRLNSDSSMAQSLSEVSGNMEVLEASDEGKKKSKFKAFKSFFGKRKKKEPEDTQEDRRLKASFSSGNINISSLKPVLADELPEIRSKSSMGIKALSHESIFILDLELETATKVSPSPDPQRGRTRQRSRISRTLPRSGLSHVSGAVSEVMFGALPRSKSRSGIWVAGSKITEIPPLHPRQPSISPPLIQSSKDFEEISMDDGSSTSSQKQTSSHKALTDRKSSSETPSGLIRSLSLATLASSSSTQLSIGFSTPATTQGCLDSSAARHKMALNPRKQKIKRNLQVTVEASQEEPSLPLASDEEKSTTQAKETGQKKPKKDSAGPSSQKQSNKTEIHDKKTTDQASNTDATGSQGYPLSAAHRRKRGRKEFVSSGMSECGPKGRSIKKSSQGHGQGDQARPLSAMILAKDCPLWHLPLKKQVMEQPTTPQVETATPQELLSEKSDTGRKNGSTDDGGKKASALQPLPKHVKESMVSGPPPYNEDRASGAEKTEDRASLLPVMASPSTTPADVVPSVSVGAQAFMDPSHVQSEGKAASSFDPQNAKFKMESDQCTPTICKENSPGNVFQAFIKSAPGTARAARARRGISAEKLPPRRPSQALERPKDRQQISDSESTSEKESDSEEYLDPGRSFQDLGKSEDEQEASSELESTPEEGSGSEEQQATEHSFQSVRKPKNGQEVISESKTFVVETSTSEEQLVPRCLSQALRKPENEDVCTGSSSYVKKDNNAEDWSSSEENLSPRYTSQALGKAEDQQEVSSVSEGSISVEQPPTKYLSRPFSRPTVQRQVSSGSVSASTEWGSSVKPRVRSKFKQQVSAHQESIPVEWDIPMKPLPPRVSSKRLMMSKVRHQVSSGPESATVEGTIFMGPMPLSHRSQPPIRPVVEQEVSVGPEMTAAKEGMSMQTLSTRSPSQPLVKPVVEQQVSSSAESATVGERISMKPLPPRSSLQPWVSPKVEQQVSSFPEKTVVEGSISMEQLPPKLFPQSLMNLKVEQKVFSGSEDVAAERIISVEPLLPKYSSQSITNPKVKQMLESTAVEEGILVELLPPGCSFQPLMRPKFQPQIITLDAMSTSAEWSGSVGSLLPRRPFQSWVRPKLELQVSAGPESAAFEGDMPMVSLLPRHHAQTPMRPIIKQEVSSRSVSASAERSDTVEPVPTRCPFQPLVSPKSEQQVSAGPESAASEGDMSMASLPPRHPSQSIVRHRVQQISSSFERAAVARGISKRPLPPRYPTQFLMRSKVQEMSSRLENTAVKGGISKKSLLPGRPSQSFVKFMVQQIFSGSENPAVERSIYVDPLPPDHSSKSLWRPKIEQQVFSGPQSADIEEGISMKPMPTECPLLSLARLEDQPEVSSGSQNAPEKWSSSKEQMPFRHLSQASGKPEHQQEIPVSESFPKEGRSSKEQLPSTFPFQATDFQPQISSTGSESVAIEWGNPDMQLPPRRPVQTFGDPEEKQQIRSSSVSDTAEGTILKSDPGSQSLPRAPVSPDKIERQSQGSEDLTKYAPSLANKPLTFTTDPAQQAAISGGLCSKKEVLKRDDKNHDRDPRSPTSRANVEKVFGVRLRRIPSLQKYKRKKQDGFTNLPTTSLDLPSTSIWKEHRVRRNASQGCLNASQNLTKVSELAKNQQVEPKSEDENKKPPVFKIPEKASGRQSDHAVSEPAWITMVKQRRRRTFPAQFSVRDVNTKKEAEDKAKPKEPQCRGANSSKENEEKICASNVYRQEKTALPKLPKSTKAVEDQKMVQVPATAKENTRSANLPAVLQEPDEPIWVSLAKKKAKAWSNIAEIMQ